MDNRGRRAGVIFLAAAIIILFSLPAVSMDKPSTKERTLKRVGLEASDSMEGEKLVRELFADMKARHFEKVESMLADGFQSIHRDGARGREEELRLLKNLNLGEYTLTNFRTTRQGNLLIITYALSVEETLDGKKTVKKPSPRLTVMLKTSEGWKWVAHANMISISEVK